MGKLFGTDGIRGVVGETLTAELAYRVGQAITIVLTEQKGSAPTITIGKDTRISSDMLESALMAGICAMGGSVMPFGTIPTPAVAFLTVQEEADAGIVISASHNPYEHNGIKIFGAQGYKLFDEMEEKVEAIVLSKETLPVKTRDQIGMRLHGMRQMKTDYIDHLLSTVDCDMRGLRVLVDCANGAASTTARYLFGRFPLEAEYLNDKPNGVNINNGCGSTHLEALCDAVKAGGYDLGIAFDGDADRCLTVDEQGCVIDGDKMMAICADAMEKRGRLRGGGFVATVMSNIGLHKYCAGHGLRLLCASVGDRNVLELMQKEGMRLGGEQSGHIIFLDYMPTGDGQLAALQFLDILSHSDKKASELSAAVRQYPQLLQNVRVTSNEQKAAIMRSDSLREAIQKAEAELGENGRVLIRPSGTEPLIRVMVEAGTERQAQAVTETLVQHVENLQKLSEK